MPVNRLLQFDRQVLAEREWLVGIDEVGRGAIAGPLMTCAVCVSRSFYAQHPMPRGCGRINDSKRIKPPERESLGRLIEGWASAGHLFFAFGSATPEEVDRHNVFGATVLAMARALDGLHQAAGGRCTLLKVDAAADGLAPASIVDGVGPRISQLPTRLPPAAGCRSHGNQPASASSSSQRA